MISVLLARLRSICGLVKDTNTLLEEKIVTQVKDFFMEAHKGLLLSQSEIKKRTNFSDSILVLTKVYFEIKY
jgi:hypothetical protein